MKKDKEGDIIVDLWPQFDKKDGKMYNHGFKYSGKNRTFDYTEVYNFHKTRNKQGNRGDQIIYTDYTNSASLSNGAQYVIKNKHDWWYSPSDNTFHEIEQKIFNQKKCRWYAETKTIEGDELLEKIKNSNKFFIDKNTKHLVNYFGCHGSENRELIYENGESAPDCTLLSHFYRIPTEQFQNLKSFYFKPSTCYGGFFDRKTNVFDEIQHKLKEIQQPNKPKCFVRLLKKQYEGYTVSEYNEGETKETRHFKQLPTEHKNYLDIDDIYDNPDNYYDYYYIEKDKIYKVSHEFVHNRRQLTEDPDEKSFNKALQEDINKDPTKYRLINKEKEFPEFYEKQKELELKDKQPEAKENKNTYTRDYFYDFMKKTNNEPIDNFSDKQKVNQM